MIAVCTTCRKMFETTTEDAYTPGVLCSSCYRPTAAATLAWLLPRLPADRPRADDPDIGAGDDDGYTAEDWDQTIAQWHQDEDSRREEGRIAHRE